MNTDSNCAEAEPCTASTEAPVQTKAARRVFRSKTPRELAIAEMLRRPNGKFLNFNVFSAQVTKRYPHIDPAGHLYMFRRYMDAIPSELRESMRSNYELSKWRPTTTRIEAKFVEALSQATGLPYIELHTLMIHNFALQMLSGSIDLPDAILKSMVGDFDPLSMAISMLERVDLKNDPRIKECHLSVRCRDERRKKSVRAVRSTPDKNH